VVEQLLADGWLDVVHPDDVDRVIARWTLALQTGEPYETQFRLRYPDGRPIPPDDLPFARALRGNIVPDYLAIGPVFGTASKHNPDPVVGLEGVRAARRLTSKPLVAIGGINRTNCLSVLLAGADSVAVISDLVKEPRSSAEEFLRLLR